MGLEVLNGQHDHGGDAADSSQQLAHPEGSQVQAVGTQTFNEGSAQTVPGHVAQGDLSVVLPLFGQLVQQHKARGVPKGLVQEGGVVVFNVTGAAVEKAHSQEGFRSVTEGLPIHKVAPAADGLADQKAQGNQIHQRTQTQLFDPGVDDDADGRADDTAVNGQAAFPDVEDGDGIVLIAVPGEDAVVKSCAQNGKGHDAQHTVENVVIGKAELLAAAHTVDHGQYQAQGDDHAVKVDGQRADGEGTGGIQFQTQAGEGNGGVVHEVSSCVMG